MDDCITYMFTKANPKGMFSFTGGWKGRVETGLNLTEKYAKHTFQAPCCCFKSGLTIDLLLLKTINMTID